MSSQRDASSRGASPSLRKPLTQFPPTDDDIAALLTRLHRRVRRLLARRGRLPEGDGATDPFAAQEPLFAQAVAASLQGRVALGLRGGQVLRRLRSAANARETAPRCARLEGFSLHADVAVPARRRDRLEQLCRSLLRPPLALERLTETSGGQLLYQFRRPWSDGSTALLLDPLELLERLAALVPAPRRPLLAYHGVLAPHAAWRGAIVPRPAVQDDARPADPKHPRPPSRLSWAPLLRRVFAIQVLVCPRCAGPRRIVGAVTEPHAVQRRLGALGLAAEPPPRTAPLAAIRSSPRPPADHAGRGPALPAAASAPAAPAVQDPAAGASTAPRPLALRLGMEYRRRDAAPDRLGWYSARGARRRKVRLRFLRSRTP